MKRVLLLLCICIAVLLPQPASAQIYNDNNMPLDLVINDTYVKLSFPLIEYHGSVFVSVKSLCELFGADNLLWDDAKAELMILRGADTITVSEGNSIFYINGTACYMAYVAQTVDHRLYVPIRFAQQVFGVNISWDAHYYNVVLTKSGYAVPAQYVNYAYQRDNIFWLARIVYAESRGESAAGKLGVANAVLNRVKSSQYPNTIFEVIFDRKNGVQYQPTMNGSIYNTPDFASIIAAKRALHGENNVGGSLFFCNPRTASNNWIARNRKYYKTIGNHAFYL